jgi:hypothetical protein
MVGRITALKDWKNPREDRKAVTFISYFLKAWRTLSPGVISILLLFIIVKIVWKRKQETEEETLSYPKSLWAFMRLQRYLDEYECVYKRINASWRKTWRTQHLTDEILITESSRGKWVFERLLAEDFLSRDPKMAEIHSSYEHCIWKRKHLEKECSLAYRRDNGKKETL